MTLWYTVGIPISTHLGMVKVAQHPTEMTVIDSEVWRYILSLLKENGVDGLVVDGKWISKSGCRIARELDFELDDVADEVTELKVKKLTSHEAEPLTGGFGATR